MTFPASATFRRELLDDHEPFNSITHAQAVIDTWVTGYNAARPTGNDRGTSRVRHSRGDNVGDGADAVEYVAAQRDGPAPRAEAVTVELDKTVPTSGNLSIRGQQLWLGPDRAGTPITLRIDTSYLRVFLAGVLIKTVAHSSATVSGRDRSPDLADGHAP
jgi:hypothetical protein